MKRESSCWPRWRRGWFSGVLMTKVPMARQTTTMAIMTVITGRFTMAIGTMMASSGIRMPIMAGIGTINTTYSIAGAVASTMFMVMASTASTDAGAAL